MSREKRNLLRYLATCVVAVLIGFGIANYARGKGVVTIMNKKGLPPATLAVIDPEGGTSGGTVGSEVNLAVGDVILFRFQVTPAPDGIPFGINHYLTEYMPDNLQVVGVRLSDETGKTILPNLPGLSVHGCTSGSCNTFTANNDEVPCEDHPDAACPGTRDEAPGSVAEAYGDVGVFYTHDERLVRDPLGSFLQLTAGTAALAFTPAAKQPADVTPTFDGALGISSTWYAHNEWDFVQVQGLGTTGNGSTGVTSGKGNTPLLYGSPVAGTGAGYDNEVTARGYDPGVSSGDIDDPVFDDLTGPWLRARYPGSTKATVGSQDDNYSREFTPETGGFDITPANPLPRNTSDTNVSGTLRIATGQLVVGRPVFVEIAAVVTSDFATETPPAIDSNLGNANCGEVFGGGNNDDNVWSYFAADPQCVILRAVVDVTANDPLAPGSNVAISFDVHVENLAVVDDNGIELRVQNNQGRDMTFTSISGGVTESPCDEMDTTADCIRFDIGTLTPSEERDFVVSTFSGGQGAETLFLKVNYTSTGNQVSTPTLSALSTPGFTSQDLSQVRLIGVPKESLIWNESGSPGFVAAGGTATFSGSMSNAGVNSLDYEGLTLYLPSGWSLTSNQITVGGAPVSCTAGSTPFCDFDQAIAPGGSLAYSFSVVTANDASDNYTIDAEFEVRLGSLGASSVYNREFVTVALVDPRSTKPTITCPLTTGSSVITGTGTPGATVRVYINLIQRGADATVDGNGDWSVNVGAGQPNPFGNLYTGVELLATQQVAGENESVFSDECPGGVTTTRECSDGVNNDINTDVCADDGDCLDPDYPVCDTNQGFCAEDLFLDFPADTGCSSPNDNAEFGNADPVECSNGLDDETVGDGDIDFGTDLQCFGPDDDDEDASGQCSDGIDNDGDGLCDTAGCTIMTVFYPADPSCVDNPYDSERDYPACMDGYDNEPDGDTDFASDGTGDDGCHSPFDDDETTNGGGSGIIKPRILVIFDTSGSMNSHACALPPPGELETDFTGGDGSYECPGSAVGCGVCDPSGVGTGSCANSLADDSRLFKVKEGISDVVASFGDVEYGLMRFKQQPQDFGCPGTGSNFGAGSWIGGGVEPCNPFAEGEVVVGFSTDNVQSMLKWMDHDSNYGDKYPAGDSDTLTTPFGLDWELRGTGSTPLEGALDSARTYLYDQISSDSASDCRPYRIIVVTDGLESCGGTPSTVAGELFAPSGSEPSIPVSVIGFASDNPALTSGLDTIALAGSGNAESAIIVSDEAALSNAIAKIVSESIVTEVCDGFDNDCDGAIDENFKAGNPALFSACSNNKDGICERDGTYRCDENNNRQVLCCAEGGQYAAVPGTTDQEEENVCETIIEQNPPPGTEENPVPNPPLCNNIDDDCDDKIDEGLNCTCIGYELCDGDNNDCDGATDEDVLIDTVQLCATGADCPGGYTCMDVPSDLSPPPDPLAKACTNDGGTTWLTRSCLDALDGIGNCTAGSVVCTSGSIECSGGQGPETETCDGTDENCNNVNDTDELDRGCYTETFQKDVGGVLTQGCDPLDLANCIGTCRSGIQECVDTGGNNWDYGTCQFQQGPITELCNGLDDDCDGVPDEDFTTLGDVCNNGAPVGSICYRTGTFICSQDGSGVVCNAPTIDPQAEVCNNLDDDCDGTIDEVWDGPGDPDAGTGDEIDSPIHEVCQSTTCGEGSFQCVDGTIICEGSSAGGTEVCNGVDDDCDSLIDEDFPEEDNDCTPPGNAPDGRPYVDIGDEGECEYGDTVCVGGELSCANYKGPTDEICDGLDNDCDGVIDDAATCENPGEICAEGTCVSPCNDGEFQCPFGFYCADVPSLGEFCLVDPCGQVDCPDGFFCETGTGACIDLCGDVQCIDGAVCQDGFCLDCFTLGCPDGDICKQSGNGVGVCEADACADVTCDTGAGEFCVEGECRTVDCSPSCASDEKCTNGVCVDDPCDGKVCPRGRTCRPTDGECVLANLCDDVSCFNGEACDPGTGDCISDPCIGIECPDGSACVVEGTGVGVCREPKGDKVFAGGRGGCAAGGASDGTSGLLLLLGLVGFYRRRRRERDG